MENTMAGEDSDGLTELYESPKKEGSKAEEGGETIDEEEREQMNMTATVPLKVLQGKHPDAPKAGDEIVVKVKEINGDQAIIEYSETPPGEIGEGEGYEGGEYETADEELDALDKKGY